MLFNSAKFLLFFPLVVTVYYLVPSKHRWFVLLVASYIFYASWHVEYLLLIIASTLIDYVAGRGLGWATWPKARRLILIGSLATNLGILFFFKYWFLFASSINNLFSLADSLPIWNFILPIGISFYTFQSMSYTIDVYRGKIAPERHIGRFALYISFFPQLVAGPIERSTRLLPQLRQKMVFDYAFATSGLRLMIWGFFKKIVIADRLGVYVDQVYANLEDQSSPRLILAMLFFAVQVYCDFSGYSDIAIGSARLFGINLMVNFRQPFFATSLRDFWRRWHISLSTWFRDYLYYPLGGSRSSRFTLYRNFFIVFTISGIWHGANWTFVFWGALHGLGLIIEHIFVVLISRSTRIPRTLFDRPWLKPLQAIYTFMFFAVTLIFFRAQSIADASYFFAHLFGSWPTTRILNEAWSLYDLVLSCFFIAILFGVDWMQTRTNLSRYFIQLPITLRWAIYLIAVIVIVLFGYRGENNFIYFQF